MSFPQVQPWSQLLPLPPTRSSDQHPHYDDNDDDDYDDDMIQEFFSITTTTTPNDDAATDAATANNNDVSVDWLLWTTLPARLHRLVRRIQQQQPQPQPQQQQQQQQQQQVISRVTASLLSYVPPSTSSSSASSSMWLPSLFQTFFTAALGYHIFTHNDATTTTTTTSDGTTEEDPLSAVLLSVLFENPSPTTTTTNNNRRGPDWKTILEQVFHSQQQQQQEEGHTLLVLFYHHLRQLEWLPSSAASVASSLSWSDSIASTTTTNNNSTTWILQDALFQYAVPNLIQTLIKSIILGNYDTDTYDNDTEDTTTTTTTTSATTLLTTILHWTDRMIVPWLSRDVFGIIDDDPPPHPSSSSLLLLANQLKDYVHRTVYQSYWSVRLSEIFDMVTSYPESLPAIQELKHVLWHVPSSSSTSSSSSPRQIDHSDITVRIDELSSALRNSFVVRLNHPGANTTQMIDIYIAAVQVLRVLLWQRPQAPTRESSLFTISSKHMNTIVAHITEPVRSYLRHYRNDTVRCILTSLTSTTTTPTSTTTTTGSSSATISNHHHHHNASNDDVHHSADASSGGSTSHHVLYQELRRQDTKPLEYMTMNSDDEDDDEEECPTMDWQPRPSIYQSHTRQAPSVEPRPPPTYTSRSSTNNQDANSDILAMLVGIYGSKELFVNEYRSMLADKLLGSHYDHENNTDQDIHTLELLKLRFGEMSLINAEVMIKDIEDSARINKNIRDAYRTKKMSTSSNGVTADAAIVSHIFWPKLQDSSFKHHPRIQILLDEYATIYAEQKNPRTLQWYNHLGSIQLELDYYVEEQRYDATDTLRRTGRTKEFTCSPLLATLISHFEDEPIWTTEQLSNETNLPDHIIMKQMTFWVTQRVVLLQAPVGTMSSVDPSHMVYKLAFPFVHDGM